MNDKILEASMQILAEIEKEKDKLDHCHLALSLPRKGNRSTGELMVIGRAVNGWATTCWTPHDLSTTGRSNEVIESSREQARGERNCVSTGKPLPKDPMMWVSDLWGMNNPLRGNAGYNTKKSPFWCVIKKISLRLNISEEYETWPSHLIWSNLYKVSPCAGGNPSTKLMDIQVKPCVNVLKAEIEAWRPKRILMLTGLWWARPFLTDLGIEAGETDKKSLVQLARTVESNEFFDSPCKVVVTTRPEQKPQEAFALEVMKAFQGE